MLNQSISTKSKCRSCCYQWKKQMVLNPLRNLMMSFIFGFFVNVNFMISVVIIYEKVNHMVLIIQLKNNRASYSASTIPLICLSVLILIVSTATMIILMSDLIDRGCLSWHRDSIGVLMQKIIFSICLLITSINFYNYIDNYENNILESCN